MMVAREVDTCCDGCQRGGAPVMMVAREVDTCCDGCQRGGAPVVMVAREVDTCCDGCQRGGAPVVMVAREVDTCCDDCQRGGAPVVMVAREVDTCCDGYQRGGSTCCDGCQRGGHLLSCSRPEEHFWPRAPRLAGRKFPLVFKRYSNNRQLRRFAYTYRLITKYKNKHFMLTYCPQTFGLCQSLGGIDTTR